MTVHPMGHTAPSIGHVTVRAEFNQELSSVQVSSSDKDLLHDPGDAPPQVPHDREGGDCVQLPVSEGRASIPEGATEQFVLNTHSDISSREKGVKLGHRQSDLTPDKTHATEHEVREAVDVCDDEPTAGDGSQAPGQRDGHPDNGEGDEAVGGDGSGIFPEEGEVPEFLHIEFTSTL